jgi:hypothetical protein
MSGTYLTTATRASETVAYYGGAGGGSNPPSGNISSLFGYDQYQILSSTFTDDSITFQFANNYV